MIHDASGATLGAFLSDNVEPGSRVITDGWAGYRSISKLGYVHEPRSQRAARLRGENADDLLRPSPCESESSD